MSEAELSNDRLEVGCLVRTPYGQGQVISLRKSGDKTDDSINELPGAEEEKEEDSNSNDNIVLSSQIVPELDSSSDLCVTVKFAWAIAYLNLDAVTPLPCT